MRVGIGFNGAWVPLRTAGELSKRAEQVGCDSAFCTNTLSCAARCSGSDQSISAFRFFSM